MGGGPTVDPEYGKNYKQLEKKDGRTLVQLSSGKQVFLVSQLVDNEKDYAQALQLFRRRIDAFPNDDQNVLRMLKVLPPNEPGFCSQSKKFEVVVQGYSKTLSSILGLSEIHAVFLLNEVLNGFGNLAKYNPRVTDLQITPGMVFFNQDEIIKVWLNQKIDADVPLLRVDVQGNEKTFIESVFRLVEPHCLYAKYSPRLIEYMRQFHAPEHFGEAIQLLRDFVRQEYEPGSSEFVNYMLNSVPDHPAVAPRRKILPPEPVVLQSPLVIQTVIQPVTQPVVQPVIQPVTQAVAQPVQLRYTGLRPLHLLNPLKPGVPLVSIPELDGETKQQP